jgi:hypothetical protein
MSLITKERKHYPRDLEAITDPDEAQEMAMLIALQNLRDIRELEPFSNGAEHMACEDRVWTIRHMCRVWYFSLADIGTCVQEIEDLLRKHALTSALHSLNNLRTERRPRTDDYFDITVRNLRRRLANNNYSLTDIGTTEDELERLAQRGELA